MVTRGSGEQLCPANQSAEMRTSRKMVQHSTVMDHRPAVIPTDRVQHIVPDIRTIPFKMGSDTASRAFPQGYTVEVVEQFDRVTVGIHHNGGTDATDDISDRRSRGIDKITSIQIIGIHRFLPGSEQSFIVNGADAVDLAQSFARLNAAGIVMRGKDPC